MAEKEPDQPSPKRRRGPGRPFQPGQSGNPAGRPRGIDFRKLVEDFRGAALTGDLQRVYQATLDRALAGDMFAAKLLLEKVCTADASRVIVEGEPAALAGRVAELLAIAKKRAGRS